MGKHYDGDGKGIGRAGGGGGGTEVGVTENTEKAKRNGDWKGKLGGGFK